MNMKVVVLVFGFVALSTASSLRNKNYYSSTTTEASSDEEHESKGPSSSSSYGKPAGDYSYSSSRGHTSTNNQLENEKIAAEQAKNAKYSFASAIDDSIMDQSQVREESRDGLTVVGSYSYTDGYFKRTVKYQADENGYRVLEEHSEPIGTGPNVDLVNGKADVHTQMDGVDTQYTITAEDVHLLTKDGKKIKIAL